MNYKRRGGVEWPTLGLIAACYAAWLFFAFSAVLPISIAVALMIPVITLHSSLQHEVLHGHPLPKAFWSQALIYLPIGLFIPYERFRDTHLHHHLDSRLTDPYDDPESGYLDPATWGRLPRLLRGVLMFNNALGGRILIGPLISQSTFMYGDLRAVLRGDLGILRVWLVHFALVTALVWCVSRYGAVPVWAYVFSCYFGMGVLKIRTYLEHQAHLRASGRTVIIEDRGPLSILFLNNNLHAVHHAHPKIPWYQLWQVYQANRVHFLRRNHGYVYQNYAEIFRAYAFRRKEPVPHPLMPE